MIYEASHGVVNQNDNRWLSYLAIGLSVFGGALILVGLFTASSFGAAGKHPYIAAPAHNLRLSVSAPTPAHTPGAGSPSTDPSAPASSTTSPSLYNTSVTSPAAPSLPLAGGMGGGSVDQAASADSGTLLPATVTVPPIDLQAADKQVLSTSGTSVTIN